MDISNQLVHSTVPCNATHCWIAEFILIVVSFLHSKFRKPQSSVLESIRVLASLLQILNTLYFAFQIVDKYLKSFRNDTLLLYHSKQKDTYKYLFKFYKSFLCYIFSKFWSERFLATINIKQKCRRYKEFLKVTLRRTHRKLT